ncbi:hypothetical protein ACSNOK_16505 [Streptomyces sp. URMC 126]|uniref:hypothetical protein n=1 Tax=Streptomyces sp. URMC 126 TaxID=3423401 RepID=UPI003F1A2182
MQWLEGALWGAFGGFAMEALDYIIAVRRWRELPWKVGANSLVNDRQPAPARSAPQGKEPPAPGLLAYTIAGVLRAVVGCGVAAAITRTSPEAVSAWLVVLVGATAPVVLEKVTMFVPLVAHVGREGIAATLQQAQQSGGTGPPGTGPQPPANGVPSPAVSGDTAPGGAVPMRDGTGTAPHEGGV